MSVLKRILYGIVTAGMVLCALITGESAYALIGFSLVFLAFISLVSAIAGIYGLRIEMSPVVERVHKGDDISLALSIRNRCPFPVSAITVRMTVPDGGIGTADGIGTASGKGTDRTLRLHIRPFAETEAAHGFFCAYRGLYPVGVISVGTTDLFGLFSLKRRIRGSGSVVTVMPRILPSHTLTGRGGGPGTPTLRRAEEDQTAYADVRPYMPGDELKRVHWKLSLRRRELLIKEFESLIQSDTLVMLDCSPVSGPDARLLEDHMVELAASVINAQLEAGFAVRAPLYSKRPAEPTGSAPGDIQNFLTPLTALEFDSPHPFSREVLLEASRVRKGAVVLITRSITPELVDATMRLQAADAAVYVYWVSPPDGNAEGPESLRLQGVTVLRSWPA